jgi:hypothetical protein
MSALIRQSHANNSDPLWASAQGGEDIVTNEITIEQGGNITLGSSINTPTTLLFNKALDGSTFTQLQEAFRGESSTILDLAVFNPGGYDSLAVGNLNIYGQDVAYGTTTYASFKGTGTSFGLSYGTNASRTVYLDKLETGTAIITSNCVGPVPVSITGGSTFAINPIPTAPAAFSYFGFVITYPTTLTQEYDVYAMGTFGLVSGAVDPALPDIMVGTFEVGGTGTGVGTFYFNPENANWSMRARLICTTAAPTLKVGFQNTNKGTSTAVWSASCILCDIVRVK